jgi:hypothetical protein
LALRTADQGLTPTDDDLGVWKILVKTIAATAICSLALAAGSASGAGGVLPAGWTHAEINYSVNHVPHTLILDRGRVTAFSATSLTLREQDGSMVQIALAPSTQVTVNGRPGQLSDIRRFAIAVTQRIDGGSATVVRVQLPRRLG